MGNRSRTWTKKITDWLLWLLIVAAAVIGPVARLEDDPARHVALAWIINSVKENSALVLLSLAACTGLAKAVLWTIGQPWAHDSIDAVLEEVCKHAFVAASSDEPAHYRRVTLFRYKQWKWWLPLGAWRGWTPWGPARRPYSGWLVVMARSGHATKRTSTIFLAPDDADKAEGIAGRAWSSGGVVMVDELPNVTEVTGEVNIKKYVKNSYTPDAVVRKKIAAKEPLPRALCGFPVMYQGKPLGVVVLDSRTPNGIKTPADNAASFGIAQKLLASLMRAT